MWPTLGRLVVAGGATGARHPALGVGRCASRSARSCRRRSCRSSSAARACASSATGTDLFTALVGLFARSRRRYGGYIVHVGIVLMFLGFAGNGFERDEQIGLMPGQQVTLAPYTVKFKALTVTRDERKQMITR